MTQGLPGQDPLAQLNDIHTPDAVSYWPLDWGWWLVIAIALVITTAITVMLVRRYRHAKARRMAKAELAMITCDTEDWPARLNAILKRTALAYCPQEKVASLYGEQWQQFLEEALPKSATSNTMPGLKRLSSLRYQAAPVSKSDFESVHQACNQWLKRASFTHLQEHHHV